jgi:hypothetical protein
VRQLVGSRRNGRFENSGRDFTQSCSTPEKLNGNLYGSGFLSVDLPRLVNYLGGGGCELVSFRYASACASKLVEAASLAFHPAEILAVGPQVTFQFVPNSEAFLC